MKGLLYLVTGLVFIILAVFIYINLAINPSNSPKLNFYYSPAIDKYLCNQTIKAQWQQGLEEREPDLISKWNSMGPKLLIKTTSITNKPFNFSELNVPLFLCPTIPGFSFPIIIPVYMYLPNVIARPWDDSEFVDMVFHEMLHPYVLKALHWNLWTPLLKKYQHEDFITRIHLHVYALQKAVYLNLGMQRQWRMTMRRSRELPRSYGRAIHIIEKEGYQGFVAELSE